jgi:hypothetical protein
MKPHQSIIAAAVIVLSSVSLLAGPGPQSWNHTTPISTTKAAETLKPGDTAVMVCGACKTVLVSEAQHVGPASKGSEQWLTIGTTHKCDHCGGEMSVIKGKVADSMQHNCSMCGEGAAFCSAVNGAAKSDTN